MNLEISGIKRPHEDDDDGISGKKFKLAGNKMSACLPNLNDSFLCPLLPSFHSSVCLSSIHLFYPMHSSTSFPSLHTTQSHPIYPSIIHFSLLSFVIWFFWELLQTSDKLYYYFCFCSAGDVGPEVLKKFVETIDDPASMLGPEVWYGLQDNKIFQPLGLDCFCHIFPYQHFTDSRNTLTVDSE